MFHLHFCPAASRDKPRHKPSVVHGDGDSQREVRPVKTVCPGFSKCINDNLILWLCSLLTASLASFSLQYLFVHCYHIKTSTVKITRKPEQFYPASCYLT